jgi:hypothetical protein
MADKVVGFLPVLSPAEEMSKRIVRARVSSAGNQTPIEGALDAPALVTPSEPLPHCS